MKALAAALTGALISVVPPAQAYLLTTTVNANDSGRAYNTDAGVTVANGTTGGTTAPGGYVATSSAMGGGPGYSSAGVASASLLTGSLHLGNDTEGFFGDSGASASMVDTVTFHAPGAGSAARTTITLDLHLTGLVNQFAHFSYLYGFAFGGQGGGVNVGWQAVFLDADDTRNGFGWAGSGGFGAPAGFDTWELATGLANEFHLRGTFSFTGTRSAEWTLTTSFGLRCSGGTDCDFARSAYLDFEMPAGVTFTSGSGQLLVGNVNPPTGVPLPPPVALLLAGLGCIGWMRRRRRP